ncbi:MAG: DUF992 domain-containing protein [Reyranella sp.]|nr:DUF992 domain-containing protein [Reyranella sp.]
MSKLLSAAAMAILAAAAGACQTGQPTAAAMNKEYANSKVYIGALTCNVSGSTGYVFGSTKDLSCVYLTKDGASQAYDGKIHKFGIDIGYTKAAHLVWHVYQLSGLVGDATSINPKVLAGNYGGEQASIALSSSVGGNWLYGGSNNQIVLQATQLQDSKDAGYNLAYGIAEMGLTLKN